MYFVLNGFFRLMLFVRISFKVDLAAGKEARVKSGDVDYDWESIQKYVQKYTAEANEYSTSQDGWLEIYRRQQMMKKQARGKSCPFLSLDEIKENFLRSPRAKLFIKADKTGDYEAYDFKSTEKNGGCYNLKNFEGQIKSVDTDGTCVRLFSDDYCDHWSQAIYPGSTNIPDAKLIGVYSIGPCVSNEFENSAIIKSSAPPQLEKIPSALKSFANVPDLIGDTLTRSGYIVMEDRSSNPIQEYLLGPGNRVEALRGWINLRHLKSPVSAENARVAGLKQSFYSKLELYESDEPGFALPLELGGPADENWNVFPQNRKRAGSFKGKIVPLVKQMLTDYSSHTVAWGVNFVYKNSTTRRPSGMWYRGWGHEIFYGYVPNSE